MPARPRIARPVVTLTSDFGLADSYVAAMKAAIIRHAPDARLIDVTHQIPRHDVLAGSFALERAIDAFAAGTVHLAVVDPGVGSKRRLLIAEIARQFVVCPDNGLITWSAHLHPPAKYFEITWRPAHFSATFHGRDIFAPVAGMLSSNASRIKKLARRIDDPVQLDIAPTRDLGAARIIHIDHFGNATTNLSLTGFRFLGHPRFCVRGKGIRLRHTYSDVRPGEPLALIGSSGLVEIAIRDGSAAKSLRLRIGDRVPMI